MQVFFDRKEANVTRISFLSKEDIQVYQMNILLIVDNEKKEASFENLKE